MIDERGDLIRVVNGNSDVIHGRYAGTDYKFLPDTPLDIPVIVAEHVFAFGKVDKTPALNRLGWARTSEEIERGLEKLGNVVFEDPPEMIEAPKTRGKARIKAVAAHKTGTAGPHQAVSGSEGGEQSPPDDLKGDDKEVEAGDKGGDDEF